MSKAKTPANPQEDPPILSTHDGSGDGRNEPLVRDEEEVDEEVVLIAIISPARTIGKTKPELHFDS